MIDDIDFGQVKIIGERLSPPDMSGITVFNGGIADDEKRGQKRIHGTMGVQGGVFFDRLGINFGSGGSGGIGGAVVLSQGGGKDEAKEKE
jgi:hypothetical protein